MRLTKEQNKDYDNYTINAIIDSDSYFYDYAQDTDEGIAYMAAKHLTQ